MIGFTKMLGFAFESFQFRRPCPLTLLALALWMMTPRLFAQTWPTYRHDNRRSGVTEESLVFPLAMQWRWRSPQPPQTAWSGPAKWDAYSGNSGLQSMRNFDPCFYVTADERAVYFGSSADDAVHALEAETGAESWVFFTGAAVRLPPTIDDTRLLFGSDDGSAYCCDKASGKQIWRVQASTSNQRIVNDRKIISLWPVRTGVLVDEGLATFAGSLVPWEQSFLLTVDSKSGLVSGTGCFRREFAKVTLQGALLASNKTFYVPQGRSAPLAFRRGDGELLGAVGEAGGVFCILTEDQMLLTGPDDQKSPESEIRIADLNSSQSVASFAGTNRILVDGDYAWLSIGGELKMLDRAQYVAAVKSLGAAKADQKAGRQTGKPLQNRIDAANANLADAWKWSIPCPAPTELIKAGDVILVGLENLVQAVSVDNGSRLWSAEIEGTAHGMAVASGRLFVSNEHGHIYAFGVPE